MRSLFRLLAVLSCSLAAVAAADHHELASEPSTLPTATAEWDQARVTALAEKLAETVRGIRRKARAQPPDTIASGQSRARMRLMDQLRLIEREATSLHMELLNGEGRDSTFPIFRRIDRLRLGAAEQGRRMFFPQATLDALQKARGVLEELRPFYGAPPDERPDLQRPVKEEAE